MIVSRPVNTDILCNTVAATGTVVSIPAGRYFTCNITLSATVTGVGTSSPTVTFNPVTGSAGSSGPVAAEVVHRINVGSAVGVSSTDSDTTEGVFYSGSTGATLDFTAGASGTSSCTINGFLL